MIELRSTRPIGSTLPLEREYEGWTMWLLEEYLATLGYEADIYSFSPYHESEFPADEIIETADFAFALQFKRPAFRGNYITWKLDVTQHKKLRDTPGIYYALPTFANRKANRLSLEHFVLCRPDWNDPKLGEPILFAESQAYLWQGEIGSASPLVGASVYSLRWGAFVEHLQRDHVGVPPIELSASIKAAMATMKASARAKAAKKVDASNQEPKDSIRRLELAHTQQPIAQTDPALPTDDDDADGALVAIFVKREKTK
jgi:hypothetical protein